MNELKCGPCSIKMCEPCKGQTYHLHGTDCCICNNLDTNEVTRGKPDPRDEKIKTLEAKVKFLERRVELAKAYMDECDIEDFEQDN